MKLYATHIDAENIGTTIVSVGFWDDNQTYGVGFSVDDDDTSRVELMVSDQSVYDLKIADIYFSPGYFELILPKETINILDGDDVYQIYYSKLSDEKYSLMKDAMITIFDRLEGVNAKYS